MKTAVVTGSTSGIGLAIAKELIQQGWCVTINGLGKQDEIDATLQGLNGLGKGQAIYHSADLTDPDQAASLIQDSLTAWKKIDLLVNNAGIQHTAPVEEFPLEMWHKVLSLNLSSYFYTIRTLLPIMYQQTYGRIVNISSVHGLVGSKNKSAYVAAKHGVVGLTKVVALEAAGKGITCNALCPGWVLTPLVEQQIRDKASKENISFDQAKDALLGEKQPSRSFVKAEDIAQTVLFLTSPAAEQITGSVMTIDGAWTAQ